MPATTGWSSGLVAPGNDVAAPAAAAAQRGRALDVVRLRIDGTDPAALTPAAPLWSTAAATGAQLVVDAPLTLGGGDLAALAAGSGTQPWSTLAATLRSVSDKPAVVRLRAPEGADPGEIKAAAGQAVAAVKKTAPGTLVEWVAPLGTPPADVTTWPGDGVDLVGLSIPTDRAWPEVVTGPGGLADWSDWAAAHGKRVSVSWSIGRSTTAWQVKSLRSWLDVTAGAKRLAVETVDIAPDADEAAVAAYDAAW